VLCRDAADPDHFYLIGEWADIEEHRRIREFVAREIKPEFVQLIEGGHFVPTYAQIVSMTPQELLDQAQQPSPASFKPVRLRNPGKLFVTRRFLPTSPRTCSTSRWSSP
jgi:hypothetical protein